MGSSQRNKGKRGEREAVHVLRELFDYLGDDIRRGAAQSRRGDDAADVEGHPLLWVEVKLGARPNIHGAMRQAVEATDGRHPFVMTRKDREGWLITLTPAGLAALLEEERTRGDGPGCPCCFNPNE